MQENKCSIQEYWEEAKEGIVMKEKKRSMRAYAVYGNTAAAAELIFGRRQEKAVYRDCRWKGAEWRLWYGDRTDRYGVVVSALLGLLETCLIFLGLRLFFFIYSGIFSSGSVGVSVDSDRCISGTFAFHFWSERVY